jgi:hypothetical protein
MRFTPKKTLINGQGDRGFEGENGPIDPYLDPGTQDMKL